jgi:hypothetical protein
MRHLASGPMLENDHFCKGKPDILTASAIFQPIRG